MIVLTLIIFVIIFGLIVFVHELGHFLMAKRAGIYVEEFAFGFPPRVFSWKRGQTRYAINLLPLGGYVKMKGEDVENKDPDSFAKKSTGQRALVTIAGVMMNLLLAWVLLTFLLILPSSLKGGNAIFLTQVQPNSPADQVGLKTGDIVLKGNDTQLHSSSDLQHFTAAHKGQTVTIQFRRNGKEQAKEVTLGQEDAPLGVVVSSFSLGQVANPPLWQAPFVALRQIGNVIWANLTFIGSLVGGLLGLVPNVPTDQVSGPVGIYGLVAQFVALGWVYVIMVTAQLSLAVAIFNILPIPALDGGRLLFIVLDKIFGRRLLSHQIEAVIHTIGFILLMGLFLIVTWHDIVKLMR